MRARRPQLLQMKCNHHPPLGKSRRTRRMFRRTPLELHADEGRVLPHRAASDQFCDPDGRDVVGGAPLALRRSTPGVKRVAVTTRALGASPRMGSECAWSRSAHFSGALRPGSLHFRWLRVNRQMWGSRRAKRSLHGPPTEVPLFTAQYPRHGDGVGAPGAGPSRPWDWGGCGLPGKTT